MDPARGPQLTFAGWERSSSSGRDKSSATWTDQWGDSSGQYAALSYPTAFLDDDRHAWLTTGDLGKDDDRNLPKTVTTYPLRLAGLTLTVRVRSLDPVAQRIEITAADGRVVIRLSLNGMPGAKVGPLVRSIRVD